MEENALFNKLNELFSIELDTEIYFTRKYDFMLDTYNFRVYSAEQINDDIRGHLPMDRLNQLLDENYAEEIGLYDSLVGLYRFTYNNKEYYVEMDNNLFTTLINHAKNSIWHGDDVMATYGWPENVEFAMEYLQELDKRKMVDLG